MPSLFHDPRTALLTAATSFCDGFSRADTPSTILTTHFTHNNDAILVHEHGLPKLAPFLGRTFRGADGLLQYLSMIADCLRFENMRFSEYIVDAEARKVSARGEARFTWKSTGQSWDEVFTYVLAFDAGDRVERYEIWADSGAAWLASRGEL
ncbi:hypothetical protein N658DRAFT_490983 [Parathielavia hyrcaniae]|uniref:SnoaL-like domain-containing protein n=1 Tax=Parathielavia hyrcaniae TaxID=113614 RepID=A0AAN6QA15_9PEZI|nr:hypothetical protein N658DRAFT_490983 [Parathielavia hyrcaniae]